MKTRIGKLGRRGRKHQAGMATIVVIAILSILLIFAMGNAKTLHYLGRNLKLVEEEQMHRIAAHTNPATNTNQNASLPLKAGTP